MRSVAIIQARTSSTRLPGKVLLPLNGVPMILFQLNRISMCKNVDHIVLATSVDKSDDRLSSIVSFAGYSVFRGNLNDVLDRYNECAKLYEATTIIRLTGDCPLTDPVLIDELIAAYHSSDLSLIHI